MSPAGSRHLVLHPDRCTACGECVRVCEPRAVKVGSGYVYVDADACTGCLECVSVCEPKALVAASRTAAAGGSGTAKVVVGSRAEAKALRKQASTAEKTRSASPAAEGASAAAAAASPRAAAAAGGTVARSLEPADGTVAWTLVDAGAVLAVLLLTFVAKDAAFSSTAVKLMPEVGRVIVRVLVLGAFYGVQVGVLAFIAARHGERLVKAFGLRGLKHSAAHVAASGGLVALLLLVTRGFSYAYGAAAINFGILPPARAEADLAALFGVGWPGLILSIVLVVVVGPVVEELIFRGVLLRAFEGALSPTMPRLGPWLAIIASSALFAAYHFTIWVALPMFALGVALGWLAWRRRSLWPPIALHALYNLSLVVAAFYLAH